MIKAYSALQNSLAIYHPTSAKVIIVKYTKRKRGITISYHAIENTLADTINTTQVQPTMGRHVNTVEYQEVY